MSNPFHRAVMAHNAAGRLVVQPRMGFSDPEQMRKGLEATRHAGAATVGTITIDSFTRVGAHDDAAAALAKGKALNGYPIVTHGADTTRAVCAGILDESFPIQVRHGSAEPQHIMRTLIDAGLRATEGGPISYCLPYSRRPVSQAVTAWSETARMAADNGVHLETFGGCLMGQLCPPSLLVAMSVLEALFFIEYGVGSVSLSYAQQTNPVQDLSAVKALRSLAAEYISSSALHHTVIYTYMGVYPVTTIGSTRLLDQSVLLARHSGAERLIVKTPSEADRIPTILENVASLEIAGRWVPDDVHPVVHDEAWYIMGEARTLIDAVLSLAPRIGAALTTAFRTGILDVPYCLHPDNANRSRASLAPDGRLVWTSSGAMPVECTGQVGALTSDQLLTVLSYNQSRFDREELTGGEAIALMT